MLYVPFNDCVVTLHLCSKVLIVKLSTFNCSSVNKHDNNIYNNNNSSAFGNQVPRAKNNNNNNNINNYSDFLKFNIQKIIISSINRYMWGLFVRGRSLYLSSELSCCLYIFYHLIIYSLLFNNYNNNHNNNNKTGQQYTGWVCSVGGRTE